MDGIFTATCDFRGKAMDGMTMTVFAFGALSINNAETDKLMHKLDIGWLTFDIRRRTRGL